MLIKKSAFGLNGIKNKFSNILSKPVAPKTGLVTGTAPKPNKTGLLPGVHLPGQKPVPKINYASDANMQKIYSGQAYGV